jgi:xylulose-5-phosphate/fructose-6-phosphate phosphoketolase
MICMKDIENLKKYFRAANYLSVSQIFLQDNFLLEEPLKPEHIKRRLLGHWGTCPGISFVYTFLNKLVKENDQDMLYVVGPGHGYPAVQSNLFLEGSLGDYYPEAKRNIDGIAYISKQFSWPYGFPSHSSPHTPGVILEGGELGYALSTSYGAVLDNPDLIVTCLIGDGEAETGPTATAWHCNKFLNPVTSGAVLPILHLNGYKISGPTVYARMSEEELSNLFKGFGYKPYFVDAGEDGKGAKKTKYCSGGDTFKQMDKVMSAAYKDIKKIQEKARKGKDVEKPQWPMIVMRTPKGWTGIPELDGKKITGNHWSHQVPTKEARVKSEHLKALEDWLRSYNFEELFDKETGFIQEILDSAPSGDKRIGKSKHAVGGPDVYKPLELPDVHLHEEDSTKPGAEISSSMRRAGEYMNEVFKKNPENFRFFSPDETYSNKLDKCFETTSRAWQWPMTDFDDDLTRNGRVIEMLSEHTLQGLMQGYVLTGRHGIFASYEAFIQIVASMADQYAKFLKQAKKITWRGTIPSFNYILTSSGWRQDHNGFSHQNPGFIDNMLQRQADFINIYLPADGSSTLAVMEKTLASNSSMNIIVAGKQTEPRWITVDQAKEYLNEGIGIWKFASDENPDIVFAGAGDYVTKEIIAAIDLIKQDLPDLKIRFVNIVSLSHSGIGCADCVLPVSDFERYFTKDKPVIINYHGYPETIKQILFDYCLDPKRFEVNGYLENGSTTTPFDMQVRNGTSRYNVIQDACRVLESEGTITTEQSEKIIRKYDDKLKQHIAYIKEHGVDMPEIDEWKWGQNK